METELASEKNLIEMCTKRRYTKHILVIPTFSGSIDRDSQRKVKTSEATIQMAGVDKDDFQNVVTKMLLWFKQDGEIPG